MKVVYIGMYGGGTLYFDMSVEEAKCRYLAQNPHRSEWDFMIGSPYGKRYSAITEIETEHEIFIYADGLASIAAVEQL